MYAYAFSLCAAPPSLGGVTVFRNGICNECLGFKAPQSTWFGAMSCMRRPKNCWKDLLRLLMALGFGFGPVSPFACLRSTPSYTLMVLCRIYGDLVDAVCTVPGVYLGVQKTALTVNLAYLNAFDDPNGPTNYCMLLTKVQAMIPNFSRYFLHPNPSSNMEFSIFQ